MSHPIPKKLTGEERWFSIPSINFYLSKKGVFYCGIATGISYIIGKLTNLWVFGILFILLNAIAYPLAHITLPKKRFDGGAVSLDIYIYRMFKYKKFNKNLYLRKRGN